MTNQEPLPTTDLVAGKYQLVGIIGRGGMGSVWQAQHTSLGTRVAIKFIEAEYATSEEARTRFDREARAAATIQSKHAIQIFDHGVTADGKPFIVMELLEGEPLDRRLERGKLSLLETAKILQQVCRGLSRAHERGVVHRDLKPENIFLTKTSEDDEEIAKVLDFGVAKIKGQGGELGPSTKTGAVLGTPFFMSPEQARGLRNVDHRTDLWSLGVIAYKCIVGELPFDGESVGDLLVKICTAPLPVPSQVAPEQVGPAFDAWFQRALDRDPERRFGSAQELSEALAQAASLPARGPNSHQGSSPHFGRPSTDGAVPSSGQAPQSSEGYAPPRVEGITAAPFSSSQPVEIAGVPGRGRYVAAAALFGLLVAGIGTGVVYKWNQAKAHEAGAAPPALTTALASTAPIVVPEAPVPSHPDAGVDAPVRWNGPAEATTAEPPETTKSRPSPKKEKTSPKTKPVTQPHPETTPTRPVIIEPLPAPVAPKPETPPTHPTTPLRPSTPPPAKVVDPGF